MFGPGVIGLELGQALHRLGVKVEIFGLGGIIGGISDPRRFRRGESRVRRRIETAFGC